MGLTERRRSSVQYFSADAALRPVVGGLKPIILLFECGIEMILVLFVLAYSYAFRLTRPIL
jgi:hypothetical protein